MKFNLKKSLFLTLYLMRPSAFIFCWKNNSVLFQTIAFHYYVLLSHITVKTLCVYLRLFILATGCPYGRVLQKSISHFIFLRIVQLQIQKDAPIPEASPGSLACQVFKHPYTDLDLKSHPKD
jgi:hypothetical protein